MKTASFDNNGRTFTCVKGSSPATPGTLWWWVSVTGESQRYAAFRAESGDTAASVQKRVLAYWEQLLADRARPRELRVGWGQRRPAAPADGSSSPEPASK